MFSKSYPSNAELRSLDSSSEVQRKIIISNNTPMTFKCVCVCVATSHLFCTVKEELQVSISVYHLHPLDPVRVMNKLLF